MLKLLRNNGNIKDKIKHKIISSNRKTEGIFRSTGLKNTSIKSIYISKLGNPERVKGPTGTRRINSIYRKRGEGSEPTKKEGRLGEQKDRIAGGKMETKRTQRRERGNQNFTAYRGGRNLLALRPQKVTKYRMYSSISGNKSDYVNRRLTKKIKEEIERGRWVKGEQREELKEFISKCQGNLSALGKKGEYNKVNYAMELMLNSKLFHIYAIEKKGRTDTRMGRKNEEKEKLEMLKGLKKWRKRKPSPRRIYIKGENGERRQRSIPSRIDRVIQELFVLVLEPVVEAKSEIKSFGWRKGGNQGKGGKKLESKERLRERWIREGYVWEAEIRKGLDTKNNEWLLKNTPIPKKYKYILKGWLKAGYIEFGTENKIETKGGGGKISQILMNISLKGMEEQLRKLENSRHGEEGEEIRMMRYAEEIIVIAGSERLLDIIREKFAKFLEERGLEIDRRKSRIEELGINKPFEFLGYTFINQKRTKKIRRKLLQRSKQRKSRLERRQRLYVYPSKEKMIRLKKRIKEYLRESQNLSAYKIRSELKEIIGGWVNYYSYTNEKGT